MSNYDEYLKKNPDLRRLLDFKSILFSDKRNNLSQEECEAIYTGTKPIELKTSVSYSNGRLQFGTNQVLTDDMLIRLKLNNFALNLKQKEHSKEKAEDDEEEEYEDIDDQENQDLFADDEDFGEDEQYDDYYNEDDYFKSTEDHYYKQLLKDMEEDVEKDIRQQIEQQAGQNKEKPNQFNQARILSINNKTLDKQNENMAQNPIEDGEEKEDHEWETYSDDEEHEWETDSDEEGNIRSPIRDIGIGKKNQQNEQQITKKKASNEFSSIKICKEDYYD